MSTIVLLPGWQDQSEWKSVINKLSSTTLPESWKPNIKADAKSVKEIEAFAFPTPLAWAEMMRAVLVEKLYDNPLFKNYKILLLGITSGLFKIEIIDTNHHGGNLGKVIESTNHHFRYFGLIRDPEGNVLGATSPETLVWPSPRINEGHWNEIKSKVDPNEKEAIQRLFWMKEILVSEHIWNSTDVAWMSGLDKILEAYQSWEILSDEDRDKFRENSCMIGAISVKIGRNDSERKPIYLPSYRKNFMMDLKKALKGTFQEAQKVILVLDDRNKVVAKVSYPDVPKDADIQLLGLGNVEFLDTYGTGDLPGLPRLKTDSIGKGFEEFLKPMLPIYGGDIQSLRNEIHKAPIFYSDAVRIVSSIPEFEDLPLLSLKTRSMVTHETSLAPRVRHLRPTDENYFILPEKTRYVLFIETFRNNRRHDVGDLRALGYVLWRVFIGKASFINSYVEDTESIDPTNPNSSRILLGGITDQHLLHATPAVYRRIESTTGILRPIADLSRFLQSYKDIANSADNIDILLYRAANSFVKWLTDSSVQAMGDPASPQIKKIGNYKLRISTK